MSMLSLFKKLGKFTAKYKKQCSALALALCVIGTGSVMHALSFKGDTTVSPSELGLVLKENGKVHTTGLKKLTYYDSDRVEAAYCLDPNKGSPNNTEYQQSGKLNSKQYNVLGWCYPSYHYTGCNNVDYFISQCAVWQSVGAIDIDNCDISVTKNYYYNQDCKADYGDNGNSKWNSNTITAEYIKYYIKNLAEVNEVAEKPTYDFSSGGTFPLYDQEADYPDEIVSGWLSVNKTNDAWGKLQSVTVKLECSVDGATLIKKGDEDNKSVAIKASDGDKFYVSIPKSNVKEGETVTAKLSFSGEADGWYPAKTEPTSDGSKQPLAYIAKGSAPISGNTTGKISPTPMPTEEKGSIKIKKVDENGDALKGAVFEITGPNGYEDTDKTNSKGIAKWENLEPGKYEVREIEAPDGYDLIDKVYKATIKEDGDEEDLEIDLGKCVNKKKDKPKKATLKITKIDADSGKPLKGAKFEVYKEDKKTKVKEGTTGEDGLFVLEDLKVGMYYFKEVQAPEGYITDDRWVEVKFTEDSDGLTKSFTVTNKKPNKEKKPKSIEITKVDAETNSPLAGATFAIYKDDKTTEISRGITDETGKVRFENLEDGKYYYKEVEAPTGYKVNDEMKEFTIDENSQDTLTFTETNNKIPPEPTGDSNITTEVYKPGEMWLYKSDVSTGELLPNATFFIYDSTGKEIITNGTTDETGIAKFQLEPGDYYYQEFSAPEGYKVDNSKFPFSIKENGEIVKCRMTDVKESIPELPHTGDVDGISGGPNIPMMCMGVGFIILGMAYGVFIKFNTAEE